MAFNGRLVAAAFAGILAADALPAQSIMLRVRPAVGDTLHMQMDQTFEMHGDVVGGTAQKPMTATVMVCTRSIALSQNDTATELLSITDDVRIEPQVAMMIPLFAELKRTLDHRRVRLRMISDGAIEVLQDDDDSLAAASFALAMPALLPRKKVSVGETWTRDIQIPVSAPAPGSKKKHDDGVLKRPGTLGQVKATFRFDSLSRDRMVAFISVRGAFSNTHTHPSDATWTDSTAGKLVGMLRIDRHLAWITDSRMTVTLTSFMRRRSSSGDTDTPTAAPLQMHMKVMQRLRAVPPGNAKP